MQHLDEGTIHAWLDGALSAEDSARTEAHVATCATCAEAVAEARGLIAASSRILTALDNVPNVRGARGAKGAKGAGRPFLVTWLVRERIAAVAALIVAAGALAVVMSPDGREVALLDNDNRVVSLTANEVFVRDTVSPPSVAVQQAEQEEGSARRAPAPGRGAGTRARERDLSATRKAEAAGVTRVEIPTEVAVAQAPAPPALRTDDSVRAAAAATGAAADRKDVQAFSGERLSRLEERLRPSPRQRDAAEAAAAPFVEPRPQISVRGAASPAQPVPNVRLLQEEQMKEGGRDVRRRIYRVGDLLVTLDERAPQLLELEQRRSALQANVVADSAVASVNTIHWTDARGFELTLTGAATKDRLEQIRRVLGY
jgi:Putative zinc-finger